jgi:hypothetical protein
VPWGGKNFTDCISLLRREAGRTFPRRTHLLRNDRYFDQVQQRLAGDIRDVARLYQRAG